MAEGEFAQVRQHMEAALEHFGEWVGDHEMHALLIDAAARQADLDALERYAPEAARSLEKTQDPLAIAVTHRAVGVAHRLRGDYQQAQDRYEQALRLFDELSARWQLGRTRFELGELARVQGDYKQATAHYRRALDDFDSLGAVPDAARTRAALAGLNTG